MVIGIDAHDLEGNRTGVGRYLMNILRVWAEDGTVSHSRIILFFKQNVPDDLPPGYQVRLLRLPFKRSSNAVFMHFLLPRATRREKIDVLFCPGYVAPLWLPRRRRGIAKASVLSRSEGLPFVLTLHDIIFEAHPKLFNWKGPQDRFLLKFVARASARRARKILVPSQFTAQEVKRCYRIPENRILVTPLAADPVFKPFPDKTQTRTVAARYGVSGPYLFTVGSIFTRRHIPECIRAFMRAGQTFPQHQFLISGGNFTRPRVNLESLIATANVHLRRRAILWLPYTTPTDLPSLMNAAEAVIWLSDYEGFGLPPLESLACGTPVITTNRASLQETVGDCALIVNDPADPQAISQAMHDIFFDPRLRERLSLCGPQRAARFSWNECARETFRALYEATLTK